MQVKIQIIITMIVTAVAVASFVLASNVILFSRFVDTNFENNLERATLEVLNEISVLERNVAHIVAIYFANDPTLISAIENGDDYALLSRTEELFNETGIELFTVTDNRGRVIAQPHSPEFAGFYLTTMRSVRHALMGSVPVTTIEGGSGVNLMVSASSPVFGSQGNVVGAVLVGFRLDTEGFVDRHKNITGAEIALFRGAESVSTTLLNEDGSRAIGMIVSEEIHQAVIFNGEVFFGEVSLLNHNMTARFTPIFDAYGNVVAILFAGHFLAEKASVVQSFITTGALVTILLLGLSTLAIRLVSGKISNPITEKLGQLHIDSLTGIYNRRYFDEKYKQKIDALSRSNDVLSLAMIDIDFFKKFNDTYGHGEGDECLKIVAKTLTKSVMRDGDFVARYGGEEFVAVLPNTSEEGAQKVAQRLIESVRNCNIPHSKNEAADHVTISIGIATGNVKSAESGDALVKRADELLYKSKQNGRNQYTAGKFKE